MRRYLIGRVASIVPLLLVISLFSFVLLRLAPGGPFDRERAAASPEIKHALDAKYHLDESAWRQYVRYLGGIVHGDLGPSYKYRSHSVAEIIGQGLPASLTLGGLAFLLAIFTGVPLGIWSAVRKGKSMDGFLRIFTMLAVCVPSMVLGPLLIMLLAIKLHWLPVAQWGTPWHAVLPVFTLGIYFSGRIAGLAREGMLKVLHSEFIVAARGRGLSEAAVLLRQALPIALLPVLSYSGPLLADLLTGSFVVEAIFQIPGIGVLLVNSSLNRDYTLVVGLVLLYAVLLIGLNLLVDFAYSLLDPRVRYE